LSCPVLAGLRGSRSDAVFSMGAANECRCSKSVLANDSARLPWGKRRPADTVPGYSPVSDPLGISSPSSLTQPPDRRYSGPVRRALVAGLGPATSELSSWVAQQPLLAPLPRACAPPSLSCARWVMLVTAGWLRTAHGDLVPSCRFASSWTTRGERGVRTRASGGAPFTGRPRHPDAAGACPATRVATSCSCPAPS